MSNFVFNPFSGTFDYVGGASNSSWKDPVANFAALPSSGNTSGDARIAKDTGIAWEWNGTSWQLLNVISVTTPSGTSNANGATVNANTNALTLTDADATNPGLLTASTQTIGGNKTFNGSISASNLSGTNTGDVTLGTTNGLSLSSQQLSLAQATNSTPGAVPNIGGANGVTPLDSSSKIPSQYLPSTVFQYQGSWDPSTNTPTLTDLTGTAGFLYRVDTQFAGPIIGLSDPSMVNFQVGNLVIYSGTAWQQVASADGVTSVNGAQGDVIVDAINELTGDVVAGPATQSQSASSTIQSNVVDNSKLAQMASHTVKGNNTGSTANASDLSLGTATETTSSVLTLTSWSNATVGSPTIQVKQSSASQDGYLSSTDWNTFNNKQSTLTLGDLTDVGTDGITITGGTGAVVGSGTSISQHVSDATHSGYLSSTDWNTFNGKANVNTGDITETSFSASNNISSATNVTGLLFATASVGSFEASVQINLNATTPLRQHFNIYGSQIGATGWEINSTSTGDETGFYFTITSAGQIQYVNANYPGFVSATVKFRAWGISV